MFTEVVLIYVVLANRVNDLLTLQFDLLSLGRHRESPRLFQTYCNDRYWLVVACRDMLKSTHYTKTRPLIPRSQTFDMRPQLLNDQLRLSRQWPFGAIYQP